MNDAKVKQFLDILRDLNTPDEIIAERENIKPANDVPSNKHESVMVKIGGKTFRCHCGCNVFHHPKDLPDVYECNACNTQYEGH